MQPFGTICCCGVRPSIHIADEACSAWQVPPEAIRGNGAPATDTHIIVGIDPGVRHCGYAVLRSDETLDIASTWAPHAGLRGVERHLWLLGRLQDLLKRYKPGLLCYEEFTWRTSDDTQERYVTGRPAMERLIGGIQAMAIFPPYPVLMPLYPSHWGKQLVGSAAHTKADVARIVNLRLGTHFRGDARDNHACDAVGIALVGRDIMGLQRAER